jgi:hypothetical protein
MATATLTAVAATQKIVRGEYDRGTFAIIVYTLHERR